MAFRLVSSGGATVNPAVIELESTGSIAVGNLLWATKAEARHRITRATNGLGCYDIFGVAISNVNSATGGALVIPINEAQIWEADTTAATNVTYIGYSVALSIPGYLYLDGATHASGTTGVFEILGNVGATSDNKVLGRFVRVPIDDI